MAKSGWVVRKTYVAECGNCGAWSRPYARAETAESAADMREVDGVAMCLSCADDIDGGN